MLRCNAPLLLCHTFLSCALYWTPTIQSIPLPRRALYSTSSFLTQYFLPSQIQCSLPCQTGSRLHPTPCVPCQPQCILFFTRLIWYTVLLTRALPPLFKHLHDYCVLQINVHYQYPTTTTTTTDQVLGIFLEIHPRFSVSGIEAGFHRTSFSSWFP